MNSEMNTNPVKKTVLYSISTLLILGLAFFIAALLTLVDRGHVQLSSERNTNEKTPEKYNAYYIFCPTPMPHNPTHNDCFLFPIEITDPSQLPQIPEKIAILKRGEVQKVIDITLQEQKAPHSQAISPTLQQSLAGQLAAAVGSQQQGTAANQVAAAAPQQHTTGNPVVATAPQQGTTSTACYQRNTQAHPCVVPTVPPDAPDPQLVSAPRTRPRSPSRNPTYASRSCHVFHRILPGQNIFRLALRYGSTVEAIKRANGIRDVHRVPAGMLLRIPVSCSSLR